MRRSHRTYRRMALPGVVLTALGVPVFAMGLNWLAWWLFFVPGETLVIGWIVTEIVHLWWDERTYRRRRALRWQEYVETHGVHEDDLEPDDIELRDLGPT